jgi:hypothetical protein
MCPLLYLHPSGYYAWCKAPDSARDLDDKRLLGSPPRLRSAHSAASSALRSTYFAQLVELHGADVDDAAVVPLKTDQFAVKGDMPKVLQNPRK